MNNRIFITGGTGYIGSRLIPLLLNINYEVTALIRKGSEAKIPSGCKIITGNALDRSSYENNISGCDTFIHLIGVRHPGPGKKEEFEKIDLLSVQEAAAAAADAEIKHFIYLSVAHPAPVMKDFINVRIQGEKLLLRRGFKSTFIRPWYVLGPGHYWPYLLLPFYKLLELIPATRPTALRLHPVKLNQILNCILFAVQNPSEKVSVYDTEKIISFPAKISVR